MGASKPCEWTTGGQRADMQSCRHASRPTRARVKIVIPTASSSSSPVHTRDSAGRAQQCWHRRRRFMTCGFFPPSMHVYRPLAFKNPPSIFLWRYFLGVCPLLETTLLPQGHFIQSLEGGRLLCLLDNLAALFMAAAATQAFIIPPPLLPSSADWLARMYLT